LPREKFKHGRHAPAFIMLFLAQEPAYGLTLLNKMEKYIPYNKIDSAAIYRTLQNLEQEKLVESYWDTAEPGPAKKWYKITVSGLNKLTEYKNDIEMRMKGFQFFLNSYEEIIKKQGDDIE